MICFAQGSLIIGTHNRLNLVQTKYAVNFGIALYLRSLLVDEIKQSSCFIPCLDESLNSQTQTCEINLVIRYSTKTKKRVDVRYFNLSLFWSWDSH